VTALPLRIEALLGYKVRSVTCPCCGGLGEFSAIVLRAFRREQEDLRTPCGACHSSGEVTAHVGVVDGELTAWVPELGLLALVDEAELESGNWQSSWPANRLDWDDEARLVALGWQP
jgi:hypothetical protein